MTHHDIPGWCDYEDAYREVVNHFPGGVLVEVGCYLGRSLAYLGRLVKDSGKPFRVVGVDWCVGSGVENGDDNHIKAVLDGNGTFAGQLHKNLIDCGVADVVTVMIAGSQEASGLFNNESLAFVFLDASHDQASVAADISFWLPKVRKGGWIGGDDYCDVWVGVKLAVDARLPEAKKWSHDSWRYVKP